MRVHCYCLMVREVICVFVSGAVPASYAPWFTTTYILSRFLADHAGNIGTDLKALRTTLDMNMTAYTVHSVLDETNRQRGTDCNDIMQALNATELIGYNHRVTTLPGYLSTSAVLFPSTGAPVELFHVGEGLTRTPAIRGLPHAFPDAVLQYPAGGEASVVSIIRRLRVGAGTVALHHAFQSSTATRPSPALHPSLMRVARAAVFGATPRWVARLAASAIRSGLLGHRGSSVVGTLPESHINALESFYSTVVDRMGGHQEVETDSETETDTDTRSDTSTSEASSTTADPPLTPTPTINPASQRPTGPPPHPVPDRPPSDGVPDNISNISDIMPPDAASPGFWTPARPVEFDKVPLPPTGPRTVDNSRLRPGRRVLKPVGRATGIRPPSMPQLPDVRPPRPAPPGPREDGG